ncbi:MAG TPA: VgrG-related protein [Acidimicrobiales bacterium]|jgi:uncharacterized protein involved in type VI secretion and phage assembly|nr:VgrG-related protein [Acidimicrobiales bacterium]
MPEIAPALSSLSFKVNGTPAPNDAMDQFVSASIETSTNLPGRFAVTFRDESSDLVRTLGAAVGDSVDLAVVTNEESSKPLLKGEVTALETEFTPEGTRTVVRGYEKTHRLQFGRKVKTYVNQTYSDIVRTIVSGAGLAVGSVSAGNHVHDWVAQNNISDWEMLLTMAGEVGCVITSRNGKVDFEPPTKASSAPDAGSTHDYGGAKLVRGANLLRGRIALSGSQQVSKVTVRSWDDGGKQALIGTANASSNGHSNSWTPSGLAGSFGAKEVTEVRSGFDKQDLNQTRAASLADQVGSTAAEIEGMAFGDPILQANEAVSIAGFGKPFDGKFVLSNVRHEFDWDGYRTWFTAGGRHDRSLLGWTGGHGVAHSGFDAYSTVSAIVTNNNDEAKSLNRVKVKIPSVADDFETDWIPVVQAGAGASRGSVFLPEVNDEVLVAFQQNDIRRAVVLGGMHNGTDTPKIKGAELVKGGQVVQRAIVSRSGHTLVLSDDESKQQVALSTSDSNHTLVLDQTGMQITVTGTGKVTISGAQDVTVKSDTNLNLQGTQVKITATGPLQLQGATVKIAADGPLEASGAIIKLN